MRIGFFETLPILQERVKTEQLHHPFGEKLFLEAVRDGGNYDLVLSDKGYLPDPVPFQSMICLIPGTARLRNLPGEGILLTGGMNRADPVTFSSIGEEEAMLCLQQEIYLKGKSIVPFEKKVRFDRSFSLYKNLAASFAFSLAEVLFAEDL